MDPIGWIDFPARQVAFSAPRRAAALKEQTITRRKRRNHTASFKAKAALPALKGGKMMAELTRQHDAPKPGSDQLHQLIHIQNHPDFRGALTLGSAFFAPKRAP